MYRIAIDSREFFIEEYDPDTLVLDSDMILPSWSIHYTMFSNRDLAEHALEYLERER